MSVLNYRWRTRDGKVLTFGEMEESHLKNCIKFMQRKVDAVSYVEHDYPSFGGEMAQMMAEREWSDANEELHRRREILRSLQKAANLRRICVK